MADKQKEPAQRFDDDDDACEEQLKQMKKKLEVTEQRRIGNTPDKKEKLRLVIDIDIDEKILDTEGADNRSDTGDKSDDRKVQETSQRLKLTDGKPQVACQVSDEVDKIEFQDQPTCVDKKSDTGDKGGDIKVQETSQRLKLTDGKQQVASQVSDEVDKIEFQDQPTCANNRGDTGDKSDDIKVQQTSQRLKLTDGNAQVASQVSDEVNKIEFQDQPTCADKRSDTGDKGDDIKVQETSQRLKLTDGKQQVASQVSDEVDKIEFQDQPTCANNRGDTGDKSDDIKVQQTSQRLKLTDGNAQVASQVSDEVNKIEFQDQPTCADKRSDTGDKGDDIKVQETSQRLKLTDGKQQVASQVSDEVDKIEFQDQPTCANNRSDTGDKSDDIKVQQTSQRLKLTDGNAQVASQVSDEVNKIEFQDQPTCADKRSDTGDKGDDIKVQETSQRLKLTDGKQQVASQVSDEVDKIEFQDQPTCDNNRSDTGDKSDDIKVQQTSQRLKLTDGNAQVASQVSDEVNKIEFQDQPTCVDKKSDTGDKGGDIKVQETSQRLKLTDGKQQVASQVSDEVDKIEFQDQPTCANNRGDTGDKSDDIKVQQTSQRLKLTDGNAQVASQVSDEVNKIEFQDQPTCADKRSDTGDKGGDIKVQETSQRLKLTDGKQQVASQVSDEVDKIEFQNQPTWRVILAGKTGSGKSTTANLLVGCNVFEARMSAGSVTGKCQREEVTVDGKCWVIVDTPGLFDTRLSKKELSKEVVKCVTMSSPGPHIFLLTIAIGRFTKEEIECFMEMFELFGENMGNYAIILFTRKDQLFGTPIDQYIADCHELKDILAQCNNNYIAINNKAEGEELETERALLLEKIHSVIMSNQNKHYTNEMFQEAENAVKRREQELREEAERKKKEEEAEMQAVVNDCKREKDKMRVELIALKNKQTKLQKSVEKDERRFNDLNNRISSATELIQNMTVSHQREISSATELIQNMTVSHQREIKRMIQERRDEKYQVVYEQNIQLKKELSESKSKCIIS